MIKGLRKNGVEVIECHENLWTGIDDRVYAVEKGIVNLILWKRMLGVYFRLFKKFRKLPDFDVLVVGYPGQFDVFFAKLLTLFKRKPIIWDVFMSIYLISKERNLHLKNPISVKLLKIIEHFALRLPEKLIIDTKQYADWFYRNYNIPFDKFCLIPTGADDDVFCLDQYVEYKPKEKFIVLYYGTYIPNHGVPYMIEAAKYLGNNPTIIFQFIGEGPEFEVCQNLIKKYNLKNVELYSWMGQEELKKYIREADVVLGAFGKTPQSLMTIQNKIYEGMAMGKVVITGDSEAVRNIFKNDEEIIMCSRDNPKDLSDKIIFVVNNQKLLHSISSRAHSLFSENFTLEKNGKRFMKIIKDVI
jgi:glycosyltransferase involved in cell wall biosynthesis